MRHFGLSKSKIAIFEQCPKRLWLSVHRPDETVIDAATQAKFDVGHQVGELGMGWRRIGTRQLGDELGECLDDLVGHHICDRNLYRHLYLYSPCCPPWTVASVSTVTGLRKPYLLVAR